MEASLNWGYGPSWYPRQVQPGSPAASGRTAEEAVRHQRFDSEFLQRYQSEWQRSFGKQMDSGVVFATVLFFLMRHHLAHKALKIINPNEIHDIWTEGRCSWRLKLFYLLLRSMACAPNR